MVVSSPSLGRLSVSVRRSASVPAGFRSCGEVAWRAGIDRVDIVHRFDPASISDASMVASLESLIVAGAISGRRQFEDVAVGLIRSAGPTESSAWDAFYDNSLAELVDGRSPFGPVHDRAQALLYGRSVLEVGACFGFFALRCAANGYDVAACDISPGAVAHLARQSRRRHTPVRAVTGDARDLPFEDDSVDTVTLIHLLEHLAEPDVYAAISEALRVARRRVVIAVPFEDEPSEHFGHLLRLTEDDLTRWADGLDVRDAQVLLDHGGWLVLTP